MGLPDHAWSILVTYLIHNLPLLIAYLVVGFLAYRRWPRYPELSFLALWGAALLFLSECLHGLVVLFQQWAWTAGDVGQEWAPRIATLYWMGVGGPLQGLILVLFCLGIFAGRGRTYPDHAYGVQTLAGSLPDDPRPTTRLLPLVRGHRAWFGTRVLAVTSDQIVVGRIGTGQPDEETCRDPRPARFQNARTFSFEPHGPDALREVVLRKVGLFSSSRHWHQLVFRSASGSASFWVPARDAGHVVTALRQLCGSRFKENYAPRLGSLERLLVFLLALAAVLFVAGPPLAGKGAVLIDPDTAKFLAPQLTLLLMAAGASCLAVAWLVLLAAGLLSLRSSYRPPAPPDKWRRKPATAREPWRAPVLGWALKVVAAVLFLSVLASPFPTRWLEGNGLSGPASWVVLYFLPWYLLFTGHRLTLRTYRPGSHPDPRPPVLYLRSFADDDRSSLQPASLLAFLHGLRPDYGRLWRRRRLLSRWVVEAHPARLVRMLFNRTADSSEEVLNLGLRGLGPLVAVGRPGEGYLASGADRTYVSDYDWQAVVLDHLRRARAVVLQPAATEGILWEVDQTFDLVPPDQLLLSLLNYQDAPNAYEAVRARVEETRGITLPRLPPYLDRPCFVYFETDWTPRLQPLCHHSPLLWPFLGSAVDIELTLREFIRRVEGDGGGIPVTPPRYPGHGLGSLLLLAVVLAGLYFALVWIAESVGQPG